MPFIKYPEIENSYRQKFIDDFLFHNPSAKDNKYVAQIKLDGSNVQFIFEPDKEMKIGKRSSFIGNDNFNGIQEIKHKYQKIFDYLQSYADKNNHYINVYGEIYGKGIQKRIYYGDDKYISFFDIRVDGKLLSYFEITEMFDDIVLNNFVETVGPFNYEDIFNLDLPDNHEGLVVKPYNKVNPEERSLYLKIKSDKFKEKGDKSKKKKTKKESDPEIEHLKEIYLSLINKNRLYSVFSKEGEIETPSQIGQYIKIVTDDVVNDFKKEIDIENYDRKKIGEVYKSGNAKIVELLKEFL